VKKVIVLIVLFGLGILTIWLSDFSKPQQPHLPELPIQTKTFLKTPEVMYKIAWCESRNDHKAENDSSTATGLYQIIKGEELCEKHLEVELDMKNINDNKLCAMWLYDRYKTKPWDASSHCWSK